MIHIRPADSSDASALQAIFASCVAEAEWLPSSARQDTDFASVSTDETILVAHSIQNKVLGFVSVQPDCSFIHHLYILPQARGAGVGRALLRALQAQLATPWQLKCVRANHQALGFYHSLGWQEIASGESEHGPYALLQWPPRSAAPS